MILVDTSIWIDHFRQLNPALVALISDGEICLHPYVFGELLLGGLPARSKISEQLEILQRPPVASEIETAAFIAWAGLVGTGIGYVDTHLLISAKLLANGWVLTRDKRLHKQANRLGLAYQL